LEPDPRREPKKAGIFPAGEGPGAAGGCGREEKRRDQGAPLSGTG